MRTSLSPGYLQTQAGQQAQQNLRNCVHCGFCNATCPTYQILGDELDGPRGRIYLIKNFLENGKDAKTLMHHLDRCLTCRNCETTCPSGVEYSQLVELGRTLADKSAKRSLYFKAKRWLIKTLLSSRRLFAIAAWCGRQLILLLPARHKNILGRRNTRAIQSSPRSNTTTHNTQATIFLFEGCVQPTLSPQINIASRYVLEQLGYRVKSFKSEQCCGAIHLHNADLTQASIRMKNNISSWYSEKDDASYIVSTASGCGITLKEYYKTLGHSDKETTAQAKKFSQQVRDLSEILVQHNKLHQFIPEAIKQLKISVHLPCTLQHGMQLKSTFEQLLEQLPLQLVQVHDAHLCCGSAGTYSLFQKKLSEQLLQNKISCLTESSPDLIVTANIGCLLELSHHSAVPIVHWIELFCPEEHLSNEILLAISNSKVMIT